MQELLRLEQRHLDVAANLEHGEVLLERAMHADHTELTLAGLKRQLHIVDLNGARTVEQARAHAKDTFHREHEVRGPVDDRLPPHRKRFGTTSKPIAPSSAWPTRKSVFSANCGPISWRPTGRPSERPHGI